MSLHRVLAVVAAVDLASTDEWVKVDAHALETELAHAYAVADSVGIFVASGKPFPKTDVLSHHYGKGTADIIGERIARRPVRVRCDDKGMREGNGTGRSRLCPWKCLRRSQHLPFRQMIPTAWVRRTRCD